MKWTTQKQLNVLAERTHELKKNISEKDKQRRNQVVDLFGVDIARQSGGDGKARYYVSISADLVYYMRFQFKVYIETPVEHSKLNNFKIIIKNARVEQDGMYVKQDIDLTPYLKAQITNDDGTMEEWIDGDNDYKAWPNNNIPDEEVSSSPANAYDILEVASMMYAEGKPELAEAVIRPEFKTFQFEADGEFFGAMILYLKYSHLGR